MTGKITRLDHVQLAMPSGREDDADSFYRDLLVFDLLQKPPLLAPRWEDDQPGMRHFYVDDPFGNRIELIAG